MSFQITEAFVQQYGAAMRQRAQQHGSRLRPAVTIETGVGKTYYYDYTGVVEAQEITSRHADSPLNSTPVSRRRVDLSGVDTGDLIDTLDRVQMLADPTNGFIMAHGDAMGRKMDDRIIQAFFADAKAGEEGGTTVSFPAANQIAVNSWAYGTGAGNAGLTISKLIEAKVLLDAAEGDPDEERFIAASSKQMGNLLATTEVTSRDYNEVQALVDGRINRFMGFNFIRTERLQTDGSGYRRVAAWARSGMGLAIGADITQQIDRRADKRFSWYAYFQMFIGATRLEEEKVVEIKCAE
jgi:hypothetical protein